MRIDFHSHSTASDGLLSPAALVARAAERGVDVLALTDHDTVVGLAEAAAEAHARGVRLVPGLEITSDLHGREIHLLAHFVVPDAPALVAFSAQGVGDREERIRRMVERLAANGIVLSFDHIRAQAAGALGRPHLARALVDAGYVGSMQQAFDWYLTKGMPGWVERARPPLAEVCALVRACGGTASLAHPGTNKVSKREVRVLADLGVDALEAFHGDHPPSQVDAYVRWAREAGLRVTGGSDFHGGDDPDYLPGVRSTPDEDLAALEALAERRRSEAGLEVAWNAWNMRSRS